MQALGSRHVRRSRSGNVAITSIQRYAIGVLARLAGPAASADPFHGRACRARGRGSDLLPVGAQPRQRRPPERAGSQRSPRTTGSSPAGRSGRARSSPAPRSTTRFWSCARTARGLRIPGTRKPALPRRGCAARHARALRPPTAPCVRRNSAAPTHRQIRRRHPEVPARRGGRSRAACAFSCSRGCAGDRAARAPSRASWSRRLTRRRA